MAGPTQDLQKTMENLDMGEESAAPGGPACPCGSQQRFGQCCGPLLAGSHPASSALALMRSRYTAYTRRDAAYLLDTWHPDGRPDHLDFSHGDTEWLGLEIVGHAAGGQSDERGTVEFVASYRQGGEVHRLRERSRFVQTSGRWVYLDGISLAEPKPGRNESCPCGSGKKFKKCCG